MDTPIINVAVIGAGQSGLSVSCLLQQANISHKVFEKGKIGDSWLTQRWDSFLLNSPNQSNTLPDEPSAYEDPEGFISGVDFAGRLQQYATFHQLPVIDHTSVRMLKKTQNGEFFLLTVEKQGLVHEYKARSVVIASGAMTHRKIPAMAQNLSKQVVQLHAIDYRSPDQLPPGAVLVIGGGTSGSQIAEELAETNRTVYMATSAVGRLRRRYRGKDTMDWLTEMKFFDRPVSTVDPEEIEMEAPLMSGLGDKGHTLSLQSLHRKGVTLVGYLEKINDKELIFKNNTPDHIQFADGFSAMVKGMIDGYITGMNINAIPPEHDEDDEPDPASTCASGITSLNCEDNNITSVIWATGFTTDYNWIHLPVTNADGSLAHTEGITNIPGLYFMGLPYMRNLGSSLIYGVKEDAKAIVNKIKEYQLVESI